MTAPDPQTVRPALNGNDLHQIDRIAKAFSEALEQATAAPTSFKDPAPVPAVGSAPPVPQPGRPPMSQRAVDLNTTLLSVSVLTAAAGGAVSAILWASGQANPTVIAWVCACAVAIPAALTVPVLALKGLMKSVKEVVQAAPPEIHQHYNGTVYQDNRQNHVNTRTSGLIARTRNELPE